MKFSLNFPGWIRIVICLILCTGLITVFLYQKSQRQSLVLGVQTTNLTLPVISIPKLKDGVKVPQFSARQVVAMDVTTGKLLVNQRGFEVVPIASMTKVMTAIVAYEHYDMNDVVTISKSAAGTNGSLIFLRPHEKLTVQALLHGLLIQSGNDAAEALAEQIGSREAFLQLMNQKAISIGAKNTLFMDPSGLSNETVSTAYDVALILRYALSFPELKQIAQIPSTTIYSVDGALNHPLDNSNRLVKDEMKFDGVLWGKTGFTPEAGHNLTVAAERNDKTVITTVINTHASTNTASAEVSRDLLRWIFENYTWLEV